MKSNSNDKKHVAAKSNNHKADHKSDHKSDKAEKAEKTDHKPEKLHSGKHPAAAKPSGKVQVEAEKPIKGGKKSARAAVAVAAGEAEEQPKATRLAMIKARHEAMKREIDQIREDLESDEDE